MKWICFLLLSVLAQASVAQTTVKGNWEYDGLKAKNILTIPSDTSGAAPRYSFASKNDSLWFKGATGWYKVSAGSGGGSDSGSISYPVEIRYAYSLTDPFIDMGTAPATTFTLAKNIPYSGDVSIAFPSAAADKYLLIRVPASEPLKNSDTQVWRRFKVGSFSYYVTRSIYATSTVYPVKLSN